MKTEKKRAPKPRKDMKMALTFAQQKGNPNKPCPDICQFCGKQIGYGLPAFHLEDCGTCR